MSHTDCMIPGVIWEEMVDDTWFPAEIPAEPAADERHFEIRRQPHVFGQAEGCWTCGPRDNVGVHCGECGHHFHVGMSMMLGDCMIRCPRCEVGWNVMVCK